MSFYIQDIYLYISLFFTLLSEDLFEIFGICLCNNLSLYVWLMDFVVMCISCNEQGINFAVHIKPKLYRADNVESIN